LRYAHPSHVERCADGCRRNVADIVPVGVNRDDQTGLILRDALVTLGVVQPASEVTEYAVQRVLGRQAQRFDLVLDMRIADHTRPSGITRYVVEADDVAEFDSAGIVFAQTGVSGRDTVLASTTSRGARRPQRASTF
jgi:hypothetical protein